MLNLYRRYRPLKLEEVVGQEQVTQSLSTALTQGKISHAYLFIGPRGCGKTSVARILAHAVNGFEYKLEDDYVDIIEIDGASNRGIDNIRELREKVLIAPTKGKYKVYIIDEVHMLTREAFNALLKTLEEPPEHAIFIMATTDAHKVPVTITSRAQAYTFKLADKKTMLEFLRSVCDKEKIKIDDAALEIIVKKGGGSFRDSLSLLDQVSTLSEQKITKELLVSAMGLPEDEKIAQLLEKYLAGDIAKTAEVLKELLSSGIKPETLAEEMIGTILEQPRAELLLLLEKLPAVKEPFAEAKLLVALASGTKTAVKEVVVGQKKEVAAEQRKETVAGQKKEVIAERKKEVASPASVVKKSENATKTIAEDIAKPITENIAEDITKPAAKPKQVAEASPNIDLNFDWNAFKEQVRQRNEAVGAQLERCEYEKNGTTLNIYPRTKINKSILSSKNNKNVLAEIGAGLKIEIHNEGEHPASVKKDAMIEKISDIMGGEVINDNGGDDPF